MRISFRRHGEFNRKTGDLVPKAVASALEKARNYKKVFSSPVWRCVETAHLLSRRGEVRTDEVFFDINSTGEIFDRMPFIQNFFRQFVGSEGKILVVSHNNLIAALDGLINGEEIPKDLNDLPEVPNLEGFDILI